MHCDGPLVNWIAFPQFVESRGCLTAFDFALLPFIPRRIFCVTNVPSGTVRGAHAHREGDQILICLQGRIRVELRSGDAHSVVDCEPDGRALLLKQGVWAQQTYLGGDAELLVLCSHPYNPQSYAEHAADEWA